MKDRIIQVYSEINADQAGFGDDDVNLIESDRIGVGPSAFRGSVRIETPYVPISEIAIDPWNRGFIFNTEGHLDQTKTIKQT